MENSYVKWEIRMEILLRGRILCEINFQVFSLILTDLQFPKKNTHYVSGEFFKNLTSEQ